MPPETIVWATLLCGVVWRVVHPREGVGFVVAGELATELWPAAADPRTETVANEPSTNAAVLRGAKAQVRRSGILILTRQPGLTSQTRRALVALVRPS